LLLLIAEPGNLRDHLGRGQDRIGRAGQPIRQGRDRPGAQRRDDDLAAISANRAEPGQQ
jgi:hypothetical protein